MAKTILESVKLKRELEKVKAKKVKAREKATATAAKLAELERGTKAYANTFAKLQEQKKTVKVFGNEIKGYKGAIQAARTSEKAAKAKPARTEEAADSGVGANA